MRTTTQTTVITMVDFVPDGSFPSADMAWTPTYIEVLNEYPQFGWSALQVDDDCPIVQSRMEQLDIRFTERFANRMLGSETLIRWQVRLQNRFDEVVRRYERGYGLYSTYQTDMDKDVLPGEMYSETESVKTDTKQGGSDSSTSKTRNIDTPDEVINANADYASSLTDSTGSVQYGRTDNGTSERTLNRTRTLTGQDLMLNINGSINNWMDIDTAFVAEFENLFMNVWWY